MRLARLASLAIVSSSLLHGARASAVEGPTLGGKPLTIDVTNTSVFAYRFNNRNDNDNDVNKQVDDFYFEWLDRFNVQASWWRFRLGARIDAAVFHHDLDRGGIGEVVDDQRPTLGTDIVKRNERVNQFLQELQTRFRRTIYPSKLFVGYNQPGIDVTVGDFYVQLGRGLVFSVRKVDELAIDTTVRGGKLVLDRNFGSVRLGATLFGGQMNPLRVDETSGRRLNGAGSPLFFGFPRASALQTYAIESKTGRVFDVLAPAQPSYLEDTAMGGRLELGTKWFTVAANGAVLLRQSHSADYLRCTKVTPEDPVSDDVLAYGDTRIQGLCALRYPTIPTTDPSKKHDRIVNAGGSISIPSIAKHGDLYFEAAGQHMGAGQYTGFLRDSQGRATNTLTQAQDLTGYALYANASITGGPVSVSLEGKHYRNYFPLSGNIDTQTAGVGAPELGLVTYSQPPTAEPIYTQIAQGGSPSVCVSGGRGRVDYRFNRKTSVYAWLGRYVSWSEKPGALDQGCSITPDQQTNTWDMASGADIGFDEGKSHLHAWIGSRVTEYEVPTGPTDYFYKEGYIRYDFVKHLTGPFSIQFQGFHRRRFEGIATELVQWTEGENYTALQWSPYLSFIFGYEYLLREECQPARSATLTHEARPKNNACHFVNGGLQWRAGAAEHGAAKVLSQLFNSVSLFVGQRRQALRCVSGVCRLFPPFEGARLEITSRF